MKLFAWGANSYGQLGLEYKCEQILAPKEITLDAEYDNTKIVSICGGAGHSIILDDKGVIYTCGWNTKGQLGREDDILKFVKIDALLNHKIVQISCGWDFNAAISDKNDIFVWGSNNFMQLGLPKSIKYTSKPTLLKDTKAKYVSCGVRHMAIVTTEGKILVCGNGSKGQLGILDGSGKQLRESELTFIPNLTGIEYVCCGQNHSLALKSDGTIYCWGNNKHGQLGFNPERHEKILTPNKLTVHFSPHKIFTGWTHSAILTKNGEIYTFGRNTYGQLGSKKENNWEPTKMLLKSIKKLSLGSEHNLAVDIDGKLFCWGWNEHGNCGTGDTEDVGIPKEILVNHTVVFASCGTGQSFAVTEK